MQIRKCIATTVMVFGDNDGTMRIVICDDEKRICSILKEKVKEICPYAEVITYASGEELLLDDIFPDLLLLDIKMPGMNGMDTAKELREKGWRKILIFVTGEEDRVFDSFDLHAFHYKRKVKIMSMKSNSVIPGITTQQTGSYVMWYDISL